MAEPEATWRIGDRVQDRAWGVVGTVDATYDLAGIQIIDVTWDPSMFRADDPDIAPFDDAAEAEQIDRALERVDRRLDVAAEGL